MKVRIKFSCFDLDCDIQKLRYPVGNRLALVLNETDTGESFMIASVNLPHEQQEDNEVAIKDYSENEGIRQCLEDLKIIGPIKWRSLTGPDRTTIHECLI